MATDFFALVFSAKHCVFFLLAGAGLALLWQRKTGRPWRFGALAVAFLLLGGVAALVVPPLAGPLGLHPSPMCNLNKLIAFAWLKGRFPPVLVAGLAVMLFLSVIARKLFCGWVCPLGSCQELLHMIPGVKKLDNLPFRASNAVRGGLFLVFLVGLVCFGVITYDSFNGFEALHWKFAPGALAVGGVILVASLFYYRPYCYLVCPLGLATWLVEPLALLRVRVDKGACDGCGSCLQQVPCPALADLVAQRPGWTADCTSCGSCLQACPKGAVVFGARKKLPNAGSESR